MISKRTGVAVEIIDDGEMIQDLRVDINGEIQKAYNYVEITNRVKVGDRLVLNTTAVELSLGTGGYHYVICNIDNHDSTQSDEGHMMKLRYTPMQIKVNMVEEQEKYREVFEKFESLDSLPVVCGNLHSMLAPFAAVYKKLNPDSRLVYIMTDGASLPCWFSKNIVNLKSKGLITDVITIGNTFGGDYECMNIYTALITAKEICAADCVFVGMGPGIAGTSTKYGFSGTEQAVFLDAVKKFNGRAVAISRISFADKRERHHGISHHSLTVLGELVNYGVEMPIQIYDNKEHNEYIKKQIEDNELDKKHNVFYINENMTEEALSEFSLRVKSMGRGFDEDREFFESAGAAAYHVSDRSKK